MPFKVRYAFLTSSQPALIFSYEGRYFWQLSIDVFRFILMCMQTFDRGEVSEWAYWTALWRAPWVLCWTTTSAEVKLDSFLQNVHDVFILFAKESQEMWKRWMVSKDSSATSNRVQCSHYIGIRSCCLTYVTSLLQRRPRKLLQDGKRMIHPSTKIKFICSGSSLHQARPKTKQRWAEMFEYLFIISI